MNTHPGNFQNMPPSRPQGNQPSGGMQKNGGASTEIRQFIGQLLQSQQHQVPMGWQATVSPQQRLGYIHQMVSALLLVKPDMGHQHAAHIAVQYELGELQKAPDRDTYNNAIRHKLDDIQRTRQQQATLQEQQFQNSQAAQMMPNQQQIMAQRMAAQSQMQQGFGMQQPLQPGHIPVNPMQPQPPQHQQMTRMGSGPDMQQTLRNNQPMQNMNRPMQANRGGAQLSPQEQQHVLGMANQMFQSLSPEDRNNVKNIIPPQQFQSILAQGGNPIQNFCRNHCLKRYLDDRERRQRAAQGLPIPGNAGMANQGRPPSQVSTGNPGQQPMPVSGPRMSDPSLALGNMDQFLGQQQDALRHQEAGQMVVPMSNPQGAPSQVRGTPTPQGHTQFNPNRPMPPPNSLPPQTQPFWISQQNQQPNPHQTSQVQMQTPTQSFTGVPGQPPQLHGQPGGLSSNRPQRTPQQNHNMPTLNQPLDSKGQTPSDPTQRPSQPTPNMNQRKGPNVPQTAVPNVQQNSGQQRPQANTAPQGPGKGPLSWPPEVRAKLMAMPENERNKWLMIMQQKQQQQRVKRLADAKGISNPEAPFQSGHTSGPAGITVSQGKAPVVNPTTSQPPMNATAAFNMQAHGNPQQMQSNGARNMPSKFVPIPLNEQQTSQMDPLHFPPTIINRNSDLGNLPDDIRTWHQLKEHVGRHERELPPGSLIKVLGLQSIHYQIQLQMLQRRLQQNQPQPQGSTGTAPVGQMVAPQFNQPAQGPATSAPNQMRFPALPEPTAQEVQAIRMTLPPNMKGLGDDQLRAILMRQKHQEFYKTPQAQQAIREQQQQQQQQQQHRNALQRAQNMEGQRNQFPGAPIQTGQSQQAQPAQVQAQQKGQPRNQAQQQPRQNVQPPKPAAGPVWTGGQPDVSKMNQKSLKRTSSEDVIEVPDPKLAQQQTRTPNPKPGQPPPMVSGQLTREQQLARMTPEQKLALQRHLQSQAIQAGQRPKAAQANGQPGQHPMTANNANKSNGVPTATRDNRFGQLMQEVAQTTPKRQEVPMSPDTRRQMINRLSEKMSQMMKNVEKSLPTYLSLSKDENHTKELLRIRHILLQQVRDSNFSMPVDNFTMTLKELDQSEAKMHEYMTLMMKTAAGQAQNMRPQQLNAANLQQQQEALNLQRTRSVQKSHADNSNRAPAAPTTSHLPFAIGAQSPHGIPVYAKNEFTTQKDLVLPEKKKRRYNAASPATPAQTQPVSTMKSSPGLKTESPEAQRTPAAPSVIKCPVPDCQSGAAGFVSKEDLEKHTFEAHDPTHNIKDPLDAARYAIESLQIALNVDENGKPKPVAQEPKSETVTVQAAPMKTTVSSQGFKQEAATPMSRNPTQTGPSPSSNLLKTPQTAANVKTPASEAKTVGKEAAAAATSAPAETRVLPTTAPDPWAGSHVKPEWFKEVFGGVADLNRQVPMDIVKDWFDRNPLTPPTSPSSGSAEKDSPHKSDISTNDELGIKLVATEDQDWVMADWFDESLHDDLANLEIPDIMDMDWDTASGKLDDEENGGKGKKRDPNETSDEWLRAWAPDTLEKSKKKGLGQKR